MRRGLALPVAALALALAGCAPTVAMTPAPHATSARCAGVIVRLPDTIGSEARRSTDAQATAAWGTPASVTLTCGVVTPLASTTTCVTIGGVDWLVEQQEIDDAERTVATTFGRDPGTQIVLDASAVDENTVLSAVADPISTATRRTGVRCLSASDAPA
jgi:hypothetical protein